MKKLIYCISTLAILSQVPTAEAEKLGAIATCLYQAELRNLGDAVDSVEYSGSVFRNTRDVFNALVIRHGSVLTPAEYTQVLGGSMDGIIHTDKLNSFLSCLKEKLGNIKAN